MDNPQTEGEAPQGAPAAPAEGARNEGEPQPAAAPRSRGALAVVALLLALAAAVMAALLWYDTRSRIASTQVELAKRLRDIEGAAADARRTASAAQEAAREAQSRASALASKLAESQSEQAALKSMYDDLSRTRDEWELSEIDQVLHIAQQQLELLGNVHAALLALQLAESRLARPDRLQFLPIRRALAKDIERLKAYPTLDLPGMAVKLDAMAQEVDALPLAFDERPAPQARPPAPPRGATGYLKRFGAELWSELRQLLVVRRMQHPPPPLLPPSQAYFLRQNLKLELLNARLSLLLHDERGYRDALGTAQAWIERYFDAQAKPTATLLAQVKELEQASLNAKLPSITDSLDAVRKFKARQESGAR